MRENISEQATAIIREVSPRVIANPIIRHVLCRSEKAFPVETIGFRLRIDCTALPCKVVPYGASKNDFSQRAAIKEQFLCLLIMLAASLLRASLADFAASLYGINKCNSLIEVVRCWFFQIYVLSCF